MVVCAVVRRTQNYRYLCCCFCCWLSCKSSEKFFVGLTVGFEKMDVVVVVLLARILRVRQGKSCRSHWNKGVPVSALTN